MAISIRRLPHFPTRGVTAVVLAAGSATRFGGAKLLAPLRGRPVLQHVLDALTAAALARIVVVLGERAEGVEAAIAWPPGTERVRNPRPADGLASSLRIGVAAARGGGDPAAIVLALGDQPLLRPDVVRALLAAAEPDRSVVVPRYADGSNPNPVVLRPAAYPLVDEATGDRGLGPVLAAHPEVVLEVEVTGSNPDVDTRDDLDRIQGAGSRVP